MKPITTALLAALLAATGMPDARAGGLAPDSSVTDRNCSSSSSRDCGRTVRKIRRDDCHRDVRTHRIGGVLVRHRHVGDNCVVREVRSGTSF